MDVLPRKRMIAWDKSRNLGPVSTASEYAGCEDRTKQRRPTRDTVSTS